MKHHRNRFPPLFNDRTAENKSITATGSQQVSAGPWPDIAQKSEKSEIPANSTQAAKSPFFPGRTVDEPI
ncbi:MAG: hypothetical protein CMM01_03755 [Rhodopirellula sp.]|nr:hypothetical protein [Rhodopirellula sp.]